MYRIYLRSLFSTALANLGLDSGTLSELGQLGIGGSRGDGGASNSNRNSYSEGSVQQILGQLLGGQMGGQMGGQLDGQMGGQLDGQMGGQLGGQTAGQMAGQMAGPLDGQMGGQLGGQLGGQTAGQMAGQMAGPLDGQLGGQLGGQLDGQMAGQLGGQLDEQMAGHTVDGPTGAGGGYGGLGGSLGGGMGLSALLAGIGHHGQGNSNSEVRVYVMKGTLKIRCQLIHFVCQVFLFGLIKCLVLTELFLSSFIRVSIS